MILHKRSILSCCVFLSVSASAMAAEKLAFKPQEIEKGLKVGYAVSLVDVNADKLTDIVVVDTDRVLWYENPSWKRHTIIEGQTKLDNVCIAPLDIDGDGKLDFALGAGWKPSDTHHGGTIQWLAHGKSAGEPWHVRMIDEEPTVHRMRWVDVDHDNLPELVVLPLFGRDTTKPNFAERGVRVLAYEIPADPTHDRWPRKVLNEDLHVTHNFWPTDMNDDGRMDLLVTSFEGVSLLEQPADGTWPLARLGAGDQDSKPNRGASEVKRGRLASGADYVATIEPWHGNQAVVYTRPANGGPLWDRHVLDAELKWGHAVWCANLDDDADDELIIGVRGNTKNDSSDWGLLVFDPQDAAGKTWTRHSFDRGGVSIEDAAAADLNGDGRTDIVAVGRFSGNVRIYWNGK